MPQRPAHLELLEAWTPGRVMRFIVSLGPDEPFTSLGVACAQHCIDGRILRANSRSAADLLAMFKSRVQIQFENGKPLTLKDCGMICEQLRPFVALCDDPVAVVLSDRDQTKLKRGLVGSGLFFGAVSGFFLRNLMSELKLTTSSTPFGDSTTILQYARASCLNSVQFLERMQAKEQEEGEKSGSPQSSSKGNGSSNGDEVVRWSERAAAISNAEHETSSDGSISPQSGDASKSESTLESVVRVRVHLPPGPYFKTPLDDLPTVTTKYDGNVPAVLVALWKCVEAHLTLPGLFRISGDSKWYQPLVAALDVGGEIEFCGASDAHIAASVMKLWLRNLADQDKLLSDLDAAAMAANISSLKADFAVAASNAGISDTETTESQVLNLVFEPMMSRLSDAKKASLSFLLRIATLIAAKSEINKMTLSNFSVCVAPNLFATESLMDVSATLKLMETQRLLFEQLLVWHAHVQEKEEQAGWEALDLIETASEEAMPASISAKNSLVADLEARVAELQEELAETQQRLEAAKAQP